MSMSNPKLTRIESAMALTQAVKQLNWLRQRWGRQCSRRWRAPRSSCSRQHPWRRPCARARAPRVLRGTHPRAAARASVCLQVPCPSARTPPARAARPPSSPPLHHANSSNLYSIISRIQTTLPINLWTINNVLEHLQEIWLALASMSPPARGRWTSPCRSILPRSCSSGHGSPGLPLLPRRPPTAKTIRKLILCKLCIRVY